MEFFIIGKAAFPVHPGVASQSFCKDNQRYPYGTTRKHFFDHATNHFSSIAGQDSRLPARTKLPPAGNLLIFPYSIRRFKTFFYFCNKQEASRRAQAGNQVSAPALHSPPLFPVEPETRGPVPATVIRSRIQVKTVHFSAVIHGMQGKVRITSIPLRQRTAFLPYY